MDNKLSTLPEDCGCNKAISKVPTSTEVSQERETKLQFTILGPASKHVDTLVKIRDFLTSQNLELHSFQSYLY